jgi:hypothetical protein
MSQNTASLIGTINVYPGDINFEGGLMQIPSSGSAGAGMIRPECSPSTVGTLDLERDVLRVCIESTRTRAYAPPFDSGVGHTWVAVFQSDESVYSRYEYAVMDNCPEIPGEH